MLFTRHRSIAGQQASTGARSLAWLTLITRAVINRSPVSICLSSVGSRSGQYGQPGFVGNDNPRGSNPCDKTLTQIHVSMKNARKETGIPASDKLRVSDPLNPNGPQDQAIIEQQVFAEKPAPRQPESPDVESLRSLLKANISREKASPALIQRIRSRMQEDKI
ncbi:MAG: hypothetical protein ACKVT2_07125 [Saprospiraceae bacterium]